MSPASDETFIDDLCRQVAAFLHKEIIPLEDDPRNGGHGPSAELVDDLRRRARAAGLNAPHLPPAYGGHGLTHAQTAKLFRAAGYSLLGPVAMNLAAPDEGNMHLLLHVATEAQAERFLNPLASGTVRSAFLMTEPAETNGAGSDPSMLQTTARRVGTEWSISGRKAFITGAEGASFGIVMARTSNGATMFLIDMDSVGIRIDRILDTLDSSMPGGHAIVDLDDVRVGDDRILGAEGEGFRYAQVRLSPARLTHCMRWHGAARRAHDSAVNYAMKRKAFGKLLIDHEGVGFMLAENVIDLKQSELMIDWCAGILDTGAAGTLESSMTKSAVAEALFRIADRSVQVMGGVGVSRDSVVERIFREIRAFRIYDGPTEVHKWSIAKAIKRSHDALSELSAWNPGAIP